MGKATRELARFIVQSGYASLNDNARLEASRSLINWLACVLGGCQDPAVTAALAAIREFAGPPQATVIGRGLRLDVLNATLLNVISANVLDFNDTHAEMVIHAAEPVAAASVVLCEYRRTSGKQLLHALVLGVEVECRLYRTLVGQERFWAPSVAGIFGTVTAAGILLGLDEQQMTWALGMAATQASGLGNQGGTMSKMLNPGHSARCGVMAALLAAQGFTAAEGSLESRRGFFDLFGRPGSEALLNLEPVRGGTFEIEKNTYKAFPCGAVANAPIDACLQLQRRGGFVHPDIEAVQLRVHPSVLKLMDRKSPASGLEAKLSVYHVAACALIHGAVSVRHFDDRHVGDATIAALRMKMTATAAEDFGRDEAQVSLVLRDGRTIEQHVQHAVGSLQSPLSRADLEGKFRDLAGPVLPAGSIDSLIGMIWGLDEVDDVGAVIRARCGGHPSL